MDVLDYPIEYKRPMEEEKLILLSIVSIVLLLLVFTMNLNRGQSQGRPYQSFPPTIRH